jgi:hypothetical protein
MDGNPISVELQTRAILTNVKERDNSVTLFQFVLSQNKRL